MAVEAHHLNLFPTQLTMNRDILNAIENNSSLYNMQMGFTTQLPGAENLLPFYNSAIADTIPAVTTDSGLTCNLSGNRKRSREFASPYLMPTSQKERTSVFPCNNPFSFLGEDLSFQFQQQQLEIDRFIAQHTEKVRLELAERRRGHSRRLFAAVEEGMMKRLKAKEEEIEKIGKLNWVLEERIKSLCVENQIWRGLAQTNEAKANALRGNLEQVLAQVRDERNMGLADAASDAESCCDSSEEEVKRPRTEGEGDAYQGVKDNKEQVSKCRNCGKEESCVLLLPCRHLCLCTACGSALHSCPICKSNKDASLHVNIS